MTTAEIANRLVQMVREWKNEEVYAELYSPDIVSIESNGSEPVHGFDWLKEKSEKRAAMLEEFHGIVVDDPMIATDFFAVKYTMDITYKGTPRAQEDEIAIYQVKDGKIVMEKYYYAMPDMG